MGWEEGEQTPWYSPLSPSAMLRDSSWSTALSRQARFITNRVHRSSPVERKRCLFGLFAAALIGVLLILAHFVSASLDAEAELFDPHRQLSRALKQEVLSNSSSALDPILKGDINYYPVPPGRPDIFLGVDKDHLHGRIGLKPNSNEPMWAPKMITFKMTPEQKRQAHEGFCFNTRVSTSLELDRRVPDYNSRQCLNFEYKDEDLCPADVVIVFHNEDLSVLLRTVHSILNRTPPSLLGEVILVNDDSNRTSHAWLFEELPRHLESLPKTRLIHLTNRRGLMMARMEGTKLSKAEVTVYLDSHIECAARWLEPMVYEIKKDPKRVVTPMIHSIDPDNFDFEAGAVSVVGFSWSLGQTHPHRPTDHFHPVESPVMAGGLFAANKHWFATELGGYDPEMKLYGGEEMEIGFKVWMCGGSLVALPCSRIGHIFRTDKFWKGQVYKVPFEEIVRNKLRTAEVWLDEYKDIAKLAMSKLPANYTLGPLDEVQAVRDRLQCKSFKWYLDNVFPEMWVPDLDNSYKGEIRNPKLNGCVDTLQNKSNEPVGVYPCHGHHGSQAHLLSNKDGSFRSAQSSFKDCLHEGGDAGSGKKFVWQGPERCGKVKWEFVPVTGGAGLMRMDGRLCLKAEKVPFQGKSPMSLFLVACDESDAFQLWEWSD